MYGDVNVTVEDGSLGRGTGTGARIQVKIGASRVVSAAPVLITGSMNAKKIKEKLGETPLADACIDAVEWGRPPSIISPLKRGQPGKLAGLRKIRRGTAYLQCRDPLIMPMIL